MRWLVLGGAFLLAGCASFAPVTPPAASNRVCLRQGAADARLPPATMRPEAAQELAALGFPRRAIEVAEAIGANDALLNLVALERGRSRPFALLQARFRLNEIILLATLDLGTTLAEIDCEAERGDQLRNRLQAAEERRTRRLNVLGVLTGAGTAALSGGLALAGAASASAVAGIVGGGAEASAAGFQLFGEARAPLRTPRNLLREIWERPADSRYLPPSVWRYLSLRRGEAPSRLDQLQAEWRGPDLLGDGTGPTVALILGEGGDYTATTLATRGNLFDLLQASVGLMHQDLRVLLATLTRRDGALPDDPATPAPAR